jgi:hypothetical protein
MIRSCVLAMALALGACATTAPETAAPRDCFSANAVNGYTVVDDRNVEVRVGANERYILTTMWNARELDWTEAVAIRSNTSFICAGNGLGVEIIGGDPRRTYPVSAIARAPAPAPQTN